MPNTIAQSGVAPRPLRALSERGLLWTLAIVLLGPLTIALSARVNVPMFPVPMTMQTFAIVLIAAMSGRNLAVTTVAAYLAQGAAGLPMFASGAGIAYFAGPTGGYLVGFLAAAWIVGTLADRGWNGSVPRAFAAATLGHAVIFLGGVSWLAVLIGFEAAVAGGLVPFIPGTIVKSALAAAVLAMTLRGAATKR